MSIYPVKSYPITKGLSEFEILKASHKFLREDTDGSQTKDNENGENKEGEGDKEEGRINTDIQKKKHKATAWEDRLAENYYHSLYREFAVCDLKHYKSGHFALRWRTETEVVSGAGESTCGNTRCHRHQHHHDHDHHKTPFKPKKKKQKQEQPLTTLELPFSYIEHGESKYALVKVVLCTRCVKKLMWKRRKEKEHGVDNDLSPDSGVSEDGKSEEEEEEKEREEDSRVKGKRTRKEKERTRMRDEQDPHRMHHATAEIKARARSREQIRRYERDHHVEQQNEQFTRAAAHAPSSQRSKERTRQRTSRSRSPPRRHSVSRMQSHSYPSSSSRNHRHGFDRRNVE